MAKRSTKAEIFFTTALSQVESDSIRTWATNAHNLPIFMADVRSTMERLGKRACPTTYATKIAGLAIGLW
jgi:hypothetical protein